MREPGRRAGPALRASADRCRAAGPGGRPALRGRLRPAPLPDPPRERPRRAPAGDRPRPGRRRADGAPRPPRPPRHRRPRRGGPGPASAHKNGAATARSPRPRSGRAGRSASRTSRGGAGCPAGAARPGRRLPAPERGGAGLAGRAQPAPPPRARSRSASAPSSAARCAIIASSPTRSPDHALGKASKVPIDELAGEPDREDHIARHRVSLLEVEQVVFGRPYTGGTQATLKAASRAFERFRKRRSFGTRTPSRNSQMNSTRPTTC